MIRSVRGRKLADILTDEVVPDAGGEDRGEGLGDVDRASGVTGSIRAARLTCAPMKLGRLRMDPHPKDRSQMRAKPKPMVSGNPQLAGSNEAISS